MRASEDMGILVLTKGRGMTGMPVAAEAGFLDLLTFCNWLRSVTEMTVPEEVLHIITRNANGPWPIQGNRQRAVDKAGR